MPELKTLQNAYATIVKDRKAMKRDFKKAFKKTDRFAKKMQKRIAKINFERIGIMDKEIELKFKREVLNEVGASKKELAQNLRNLIQEFHNKYEIPIKSINFSRPQGGSWRHFDLEIKTDSL